MGKSSLGTAALAVLVGGAWLAPIATARAAEDNAARFDALESENARLRRENAALRERVRLQNENATLRGQLGEKPVPAARPAAAPTSSNPALQAYAADRPVTKAPPLGPAPYNWTGFYIGAHFGAGWSRNQWTDLGRTLPCDPVFCPSPDLGAHNGIGVLGGGQIGLNWQIGRTVLGIEGQYSLADLKGDHQNSFQTAQPLENGSGTVQQTFSLSTHVKDLGTIAGRIGLTADGLDRTLFYVKGGAAFARTKYSAAEDLSGTFCSDSGCVVISTNSSFSGSQTRWGWMAGIGLEHGLFDNWSAKVEYNYLDFGSKTVSLSGITCLTGVGCGPTTRAFDTDQSIHVIKFGLNYRFGGFSP